MLAAILILSFFVLVFLIFAVVSYLDVQRIKKMIHEQRTFLEEQMDTIKKIPKIEKKVMENQKSIQNLKKTENEILPTNRVDFSLKPREA